MARALVIEPELAIEVRGKIAGAIRDDERVLVLQDELWNRRGARRGLNVVRIARKMLVAHAGRTGIVLAKLWYASCGSLKSPRCSRASLRERLARTPFVHTRPGRFDLPGLRDVVPAFPRTKLVSISDSQRAPLDGLDLDWRATVHHGLPVHDIPFSAGSGHSGYLAFL